MTHYYTTSADAIEQEIVQPLEHSEAVNDAGAEYDVRAIFDECFTFDVEKQSFYQSATENEFWESIQRNSHFTATPVLLDEASRQKAVARGADAAAAHMRERLRGHAREQD